MAALVEHYKKIELAEPEDDESGKAHSTRTRLTKAARSLDHTAMGHSRD